MELQLNQSSDEDLVAAARSGNREAYAALVRRHAKRVYAVCIGILGNTDDSEDAVQETFVKGIANILTLRDGKQFAGWICQIARNLCRDQWRTRKRRRELMSRHAVEEATESGEFSDLHDALERLPEEHRLPLMLYYFDGRSTENLARELKLTRGGACTRLFRARNELRKLLEDHEEAK